MAHKQKGLYAAGKESYLRRAKGEAATLRPVAMPLDCIQRKRLSRQADGLQCVLYLCG